MRVFVGDMLHAAFISARNLTIKRISPHFQIGAPFVTSILLVATGKRQKRDRGINILLRRSFGETGAEPVVNNLPGAR